MFSHVDGKYSSVDCNVVHIIYFKSDCKHINFQFVANIYFVLSNTLLLLLLIITVSININTIHQLQLINVMAIVSFLGIFHQISLVNI